MKDRAIAFIKDKPGLAVVIGLIVVAMCWYVYQIVVG